MRGYLVLIIVLLALPTVAAADMVIINSEDWHDVYSGMIYAKLAGIDVHYVAEKTQGLQLIQEVLPKYMDEIYLIESEKPVISGYQSLLEQAGFSVEKYLSENYQKTNLDLAKKLDKNKFVVIDGTLGYSAISVAPYSLLTDSFVLFTDEKNIAEIKPYLENADEIVSYGRVDREVKEQLSPSKIIDNEDIHKNNIEIIQEFLKKKPVKQVYLTNGEIIETGFFNKEFPVLFIGTDKVPERVLNFIKETDIRAGVVIGYDLYLNSKQIREKTGIKILLKYGQGRNSQLYALDVFPLPKYDPRIEIKKVEYNSLTKQLEVTYQNTGNVYTTVQALSHTIKSENLTVEEVSDKETFFFNENDFRTTLHDIDLTSYLNTELSLKSIVAYGQSESSLTKLLTVEDHKIEIISAEDSSKIEIKNVVYNKNTERFEITILNKGKKAVYTDLEIVDLMINNEKVTLPGEQKKILPNSKETFKIKAVLDKSDFEDNKKVTVQVRYGERKDILLKSMTKEFDFIIKKSNYKALVLAVIILVIILLVNKIKKRKRDDY